MSLEEEDISEINSNTSSLSSEKEIDESHHRDLKAIYSKTKTTQSRNDYYAHSKTVSK